MYYSVFLQLSYFLTFSSATSAGEGVLCNALDPNLGCETPGVAPCDEDTQADSETKIMWWVKPAVRSNEYSVRTGDGDPSKDPTSYTPNQYMNIHVRTLVYNLQYAGLLLYAEDVGGIKVGEWSIPPESAFWLAPECNNKAVLHRNGSPKPYHMVFGFKAPIVGTGDITIRTLLKYGEPFPNISGKFIWPNSEDIILKETLPKTPNWFQGLPGKSCDTVCQENSLACDQDTMRETQISATALSDAISSHYYCPKPLLSSCSAISPSSGANGCYYHDDDCKGAGRLNSTSQSIQCDAQANDEARFCLCSIPTSGSKTKSVSWLWFFVILGSYLFPNMTGPYHNGILKMFLFFACLSFCQGHNWLNNPSRSGKLSFSHPCPGKTRTHLQVGPGQKFPLEWASGHPGSREHYFVVVSAKNADKLKGHDFKILNDYINSAPMKDTWLDNEENQKYHVSLLKAGTDVNRYESEVLPSDPLYIKRPTYFSNRTGKVDTGYPKIYKFKPSQLTRDVRAQYKSDKYPWIIAIYKFRVMVREPKHGDMALFEIPKGSPSGKYIIHWMWEGYRDCVDINLLSADSTKVQGDWGKAGSGNRYEQIDHCRIPKFDRSQGCKEIAPGENADACKAACTRSGRCNGINVIPWNDPSPWNLRDPGFKKACAAFKPQNNESHVCYSFRALSDPNKQVAAVMTETIDPDDPVFYGTCYRKKPNWGFEESCPACEDKKQVPAWRYHDRCVDCDTATNNDKPDVTPTWKFADICIDCHKDL